MRAFCGRAHDAAPAPAAVISRVSFSLFLLRVNEAADAVLARKAFRTLRIFSRAAVGSAS